MSEANTAPDPSSIIAVLTGDVVDSRKLPPEIQLHLNSHLREVAEKVKKLLPEGAINSEISIFRGDSWQLVVPNPNDAFTVAVAFRAALMALIPRDRGRSILDTRIAIGIGKSGQPVSERITESVGEAFELSGLLLDELSKKNRHFGIQFSENFLINPDKNEAYQLVALMLDPIFLNWTSRQAESVFGKLQGWSQDKIAEKWSSGDTDQASIARHLEKANFDVLERAIRFCSDFSENSNHEPPSSLPRNMSS